MPLSQVSIWYLKLVTSRVPSGLASRQRGAHVLPAGTYLGKQCPPFATAVPADASFGLVEAMGHPAVRAVRSAPAPTTRPERKMLRKSLAESKSPGSVNSKSLPGL